MRQFVERAGRNATYTSTDAVFDFVEAIGTWVDTSLLKVLQKAPFFSLIADECTDIATIDTIEELSIFCWWVQDGEPVGRFFEIIPLKKADAASIYTSLIDWLTKKVIQISKLAGMGFDGAATFSGKKSGVQARLKKISPHSLILRTVATTCFN